MKHNPFTLLLHIALAVILAGAIVTHFLGIQGTLSLKTGAAPISAFDKTSGPGDGRFPFEVSLEDVEIIYYPATTTPMDFRSLLRVDSSSIRVSMNRVGEYDGWHFYQSGINADGSVLSISHDPWGTGITYAGYLMLGIGMVGFFFQRRTPWRALLRRYRKGMAVLMLLGCFFCADAAPSDSSAVRPLRAMQRPLASNFGRVKVYWNDRICPMQTLARDVAGVLYNSYSYKGFTPEQILSGWLFYYDEWRADYLREHPELETVAPYPTDKAEKKSAERLALVQWLGTGEIFGIYPYQAVDGHVEWLSLTGKRPSGMELDQWIFMQTTMPGIKKLLMQGKNIRANEELGKLIEGQKKYAPLFALPTDARINAERIYNAFARPSFAAIAAVCIGLATLIGSIFRGGSRRRYKILSRTCSILLWLYLSAVMGVLWWISGHVPLSNGPETMMFMAFVALLGAGLCGDMTLRGGLLIVASMALFVTAMGGRTPQIRAMMPVLASPLLSIHVMLVMISYALFALMAILSAVALLARSRERSIRLGILNRIILTPAVFLLGAGIFIGAVWANQTWGRYWGWDPKETCALVMWLVYALPVHWGGRHLSVFRKERVLHIYLLCAILTVVFTYFGANYLLSGLHSYA